MLRLLSLLLCALMVASPVQAYSYRTQADGNFTGYGTSGTAITWYENQVAMGVNFGEQWNPAARDALQQWNEVNANFEWAADSTSSKLCVNDGINSSGWSDDRCGGDWGSVVATTRVSMSRIGGQWYITDADVVFNKELIFDNYTGPHRYNDAGQAVYDFVRVALHEYGHAMGLLHPDDLGQSVDSIMNSGHSALSNDQLQSDDIDGAHFLYGSNGDPSLNSSPRHSVDIDLGSEPAPASEPVSVGSDLGGGGGGSLAPWCLLGLLLIRRRH